MKSRNKNRIPTGRWNLSQNLQCGLSQSYNACRTDLILFLVFHGFPYLEEGRETFVNTILFSELYVFSEDICQNSCLSRRFQIIKYLENLCYNICFKLRHGSHQYTSVIRLVEIIFSHWKGLQKSSGQAINIFWHCVLSRTSEKNQWTSNQMLIYCSKTDRTAILVTAVTI